MANDYLPGHIINTFGVKSVMNLVLVLISIRYGFYSGLTSPSQTLYLEFFNGWIIALLSPVITLYAAKVAPKNAATTMTALAYAVYDGVGKCLKGTRMIRRQKN